MKTKRFVVMGGCHVVGYPHGPSYSFPALLCSELGSEIVGQVANLQFLRLPDHFARIQELQPSHVILQLGNYEFSASFYHLMRQFKRAFGLAVIPNGSSDSSSSSSLQINSVDALPAKGWLDAYVRVVGLGVLTIGTWLFSNKHRRVFRDLNDCIAQRPNTEFIFLSPFPCLDPPANTLRRLGGWLLRRGLNSRPNSHWLNTHQVIAPSQEFFSDHSHLSKAGQEALAHALVEFFRGRESVTVPGQRPAVLAI